MDCPQLLTFTFGFLAFVIIDRKTDSVLIYATGSAKVSRILPLFCSNQPNKFEYGALDSSGEVNRIIRIRIFPSRSFC